MIPCIARYLRSPHSMPAPIKTREVDEPDSGDKWEVQLRKGCLELAILATLWGGKLYGLEILRRESRQKDRKSTRLNSSHTVISYAVFCLQKKKRYTSSSKSPQSLV